VWGLLFFFKSNAQGCGIQSAEFYHVPLSVIKGGQRIIWQQLVLEFGAMNAE